VLQVALDTVVFNVGHVPLLAHFALVRVDPHPIDTAVGNLGFLRPADSMPFIIDPQSKVIKTMSADVKVPVAPGAASRDTGDAGGFSFLHSHLIPKLAALACQQVLIFDTVGDFLFGNDIAQAVAEVENSVLANGAPTKFVGIRALETLDVSWAGQRASGYKKNQSDFMHCLSLVQ
jgi:hypothetical protein